MQSLAGPKLIRHRFGFNERRGRGTRNTKAIRDRECFFRRNVPENIANSQYSTLYPLPAMQLRVMAT